MNYYQCILNSKNLNRCISLRVTAGKTKTYEEVEEMLEGGDPAIYTSDVSTKYVGICLELSND